MRSLTQFPHANEDRGAVLVLVAVMMTALVGMAALVIDIGSLYVEKRELQNGGDAAALAVAQDCAAGDCGNEAAMAQTYANNNSRDAASTLDAVCGVGPSLATCTDAAPPLPSGASGWVRVRTSTATPDGGDEVDFFLAPVINGGSGGTVRASAVAAWGPVGSAIASPLTVSQCEFQALGGNLSAGTFPTGSATFYFHGVGGTSSEPGVTRCTASPSGQDLPGGFGWLDSSTSCRLSLSADGWVSGDSGNNVPAGCVLSTWRNQELVVAIYDAERGTGGGEYHIAGFIGLIITGYRFPGGPANRWPSSFTCPAAPGGSGSCIRGEFSRFSTSLGTFGGGADFGGRVIRMVG